MRESLWGRIVAAFLCGAIAGAPVQVYAWDLVPPAESYSFVEKSPAPAAGAKESLTRTQTPTAKNAPVNNSGAFTYSLSIDVPPGRAGMTPSLALNYSSGAFRTEGDIAAGWTLNLPVITRSIRDGSPWLGGQGAARFYADDLGKFEGPSGTLVPTSDGPSGVQGVLYMPEREHEPVRYELIGYQSGSGTRIEPPGGQRWIEYLPNGNKRYYGAVSGREGRIRNQLGTFAWLLLEEVDPSGNHISYEYRHQDATPDNYDCRPYPTLRRISWGGNKTTGLPHPFAVDLQVSTYDGKRDMLNGRVVHNERISQVRVYGPDEFGNSVNYWSYLLEATPSTDTGRLLLRSIERTAPGEAALAWQFDYSGNDGRVEWNSRGQDLTNEPGFYGDGYIVDENMTEAYAATTSRDAKINLKAREMYLRRNLLGSKTATKFIDVNGDSTLDAVYHPAGTVAPTAGIVPSETFLQSPDGSWESLLPGASPQFFGDFNDLADLDRDGDADGIGFSTIHFNGKQFTGLEDAVASGNPEGQESAFCVTVANSCCPDNGLTCGLSDFMPYEECPGGSCPMYGMPEIFHYRPGMDVELARWFVEDVVSALEGQVLLPGMAPITVGSAGIDGQSLESLPPSDSQSSETAGSVLVPDSPMAAAGGGGGALCGFGAGLCAAMNELYSFWCPVEDFSNLELLCESKFQMCREICQVMRELEKEGYEIPEADKLKGKYEVMWVCENGGAASTAGIPSNKCDGVLLEDWPPFIGQSITWFDREYEAGSGKINSRLEATVDRDFYAPLSDVNGDGRPDLVLLKGMSHAISTDVSRNVKFEPRVYLGDSLEFMLDRSVGYGFSFSISAINILKNGLPGACYGHGDCWGRLPYFQTENFTTLLLDLNSDGLPDLVRAEPPRKVPGKKDKECMPGHRVHLNDGYEWVEDGSVDGWASPAFATTYGMHPFLQLRNSTPPAIGEMRPDPSCEDNLDYLVDGLDRRPNPEGGIGRPLSIRSSAFTDLNADGRIDIAFAPGFWENNDVDVRYGAFLATNRGFAPNIASRYTFPTRSHYYFDTGTDMKTLHSSLAVAQKPFMLSLEHPAANLVAGDVESNMEMGRFVDIDNDGLVDLVTPGACAHPSTTEILDAIWSGSPLMPTQCKPARWHKNMGKVPDLLVSVDEPRGAFFDVEYVASTSKEALATVSGSLPPIGTMVVSTIRRGVTRGGESEVIHAKYENWARSKQLNESIGFRTVALTFESRFRGLASEKLTITRTFNTFSTAAGGGGRPYPLKGLLTETRQQAGSYTVTERPTYFVTPLGPTAVRIRQRASVTTECSGSTCTSRAVESQLPLDEWGYPLETVEGNSISGGCTSGTNGSWCGAVDFDGTEVRRVMEYDHRTSAGVWKLGLTTSESVFGPTEDLSGNPIAGAQLDRVERTYDAQGRLSTSTRPALIGAGCPGAEAFNGDDRTVFHYRDTGTLSATVKVNVRTTVAEPDGYDLYARYRETRVPRFVDGVETNEEIVIREDYGYDYRTGAVRSVTDANGRTRTKVYDSHGRVVEERGPAGDLLVQMAYDDDASPTILETVHLDSTKSYQRKHFLDGAGRTLATVRRDPSYGFVRTVATEFDAAGRARRTYLPRTVASLDDWAILPGESFDASEYDGFDRTTRRIRADGQQRSWFYEPRKTTETNPRGFPIARMFDWNGALSLVERTSADEFGAAVVAPTHYVRDGLGRIVRIIDADGYVRNFERDAFGRLRRVNLPHVDCGSSCQPAESFDFCHDRDDLVVLTTNPNGETTQIHRDALGRPYRRISSGVTSEEIIYTYDQHVDLPNAEALGRLARVSDATGTTSYSYDEWGRVRELAFEPHAAITQLAPAVPARFEMVLEYDFAGSPIEVIVSGGSSQAMVTLHQLGFERDSIGRVNAVRSTDGLTNAALVGPLAYNTHDQLASASFYNGGHAAWDWNPQNKLLRSIVYSDDVLSEVARVSYDAYDRNDNILSESRSTFGSVVVSKGHEYDGFDRLARTYGTAPGGMFDEEYFYSLAGNLDGAGDDSYAYQHPSLSQVVTEVSSPEELRTLTYNAAGQLELDERLVLAEGRSERRSLAYSPSGCLAHVSQLHDDGVVTSSTDTTYRCNHEGKTAFRRSVNNGPGAQTHTRLDIGDFLEIRPELGISVARIRVNGTAVVEEARDLVNGARVAAQSSVTFADVRGSILAEASFSGPADVLVREADYGAWGETRQISGSAVPRHGYTGADPAPYLGYYQFGVRTYDPTLRRWLTPDPLLAAAPEADSLNGEELNLYAYAGNNPLRFVDRTGTKIIFAQNDAEAQKLVGALAAHPAFQQRIEAIELSPVEVKVTSATFLSGAEWEDTIAHGGAMVTTPDGVSDFSLQFDSKATQRMTNAAGLKMSPLQMMAHELSGHVGGAIVDGEPTHNGRSNNPKNDAIAVREENKARGHWEAKRQTHSLSGDSLESAVREKDKILEEGRSPGTETPK